jgi:hypothetical protein
MTTPQQIFKNDKLTLQQNAQHATQGLSSTPQQLVTDCEGS